MTTSKEYRVAPIMMAGFIVGYKMVDKSNISYLEVNENEKYRVEQMCKVWNQ